MFVINVSQLLRHCVYNTHVSWQVLPRQTCGLFTKNLYFRDYPGGRHRLESSVFGGELFLTFVFTPVS